MVEVDAVFGVAGAVLEAVPGLAVQAEIGGGVILAVFDSAESVYQVVLNSAFGAAGRGVAGAAWHFGEAAGSDGDEVGLAGGAVALRIAGQAVGVAADAYSVFQVEGWVALGAHKIGIIAGAI